jgi:hypothetical protein
VNPMLYAEHRDREGDPTHPCPEQQFHWGLRSQVTHSQAFQALRKQPSGPTVRKKGRCEEKADSLS